MEERDGGRAGEALGEGATRPAVQRHRVQVGPAGPRGQLPAQQGQVCQAEEQKQAQGRRQLREKRQEQHHSRGEGHPANQGGGGQRQR